MNLQDQNLQTILSMSNMEHQYQHKISKTSSVVLDSVASQNANKKKQENLQQQLQEQRQFYLDNKKQEVEDIKIRKTKEIIEKRAKETQGFIKHQNGFRQIFPTSSLFSQTQFVQPDREIKEVNKIPFSPLKKRIQQSLEAKHTSQNPWISSHYGQDTFDLNQTFKPTPQEQKQIEDMKEKYKNQKFDYKNFKNFLKTKYNNSSQNTVSPTFYTSDKNQQLQKDQRNKQVTLEQEDSNTKQFAFPRSNTVTSGFIAQSQPNTPLNKQRTQSNERNPNQNHQPIILQRPRGGIQSFHQSFKRIQSPANTSAINSTFTNKIDFIQCQDKNIQNKNYKVISMNNPIKRIINPLDLVISPTNKLNISLQRLNSPLNSISSPINTLNSPLNQINSQFDKMNSPINYSNDLINQNLSIKTGSNNLKSQENQILKRNCSQSLFNQSLQNQNKFKRCTSPTWKFGYTNKMNDVFQTYSIDTQDVKVNQPKTQNYIFKPSGNHGNLFTEYQKDQQNYNYKINNSSGRERVFSTPAMKKQTISS